MTILKKIAEKRSQIGMAFTNDAIEKDGSAIADFRNNTVKTAEALLAKGFVKGSDIRSPWNGVGSFVGAANFGMVTTMIEDSVGVVINSFSGFGSSIIDLRYLIRHGFETFGQVSSKGKAADKARAENVRLFLETFQGKFDCANRSNTFNIKIYESVTATSEEAGGYRLVDVDPIKANEVIKQLLRLDVEKVKLTELLAACEDMAAVTRQSAECTIDTYKKPVLIVIAGVPGLAALKKGVKYMSHDKMEIAVNWGRPVYEGDTIISPSGSVNLLVNDRLIVRRKGDKLYSPIVVDGNGMPETCFFDHHDLGSKGSYQIDITDKNNKLLYKELHLCDINQRVRLQLFQQFATWLKPIVSADMAQSMLPVELKKIGEVVRRYNKAGNYNIGLLNAIRAIGEEYLSAHSASVSAQAEKTSSGLLNGKSKIVLKDEIDQEKAEGSAILDALTNKARVTFDQAERILSDRSHQHVVISPADRVRIVWKVVLENATRDGIVAWKELGTLAQNLLGPEYMLWVLDAFKGQTTDDNGNTVDFDMLVPKYTRDRIRPVGILSDATVEELLELDGVTVPFTAGFAVDEDGNAFFESKVALDGNFVVRVEQDENGRVTLFATHDIASLVVVPKGDPSKVCVKLCAADTETIDKIAQMTNTADTVLLSRGNKLAVYGENGLTVVGQYIVPKFEAATMVLNIDYNKESNNVGVKGTVNFYKTFDYFNSSKDRWESSAFLIVNIDAPATPGEVEGLLQ